MESSSMTTYSCFHCLETICQLLKPLNRYIFGSSQDLPILPNVPLNALHLRIGQNKETHSKSNQIRNYIKIWMVQDDFPFKKTLFRNHYNVQLGLLQTPTEALKNPDRIGQIELVRSSSHLS